MSEEVGHPGVVGAPREVPRPRFRGAVQPVIGQLREPLRERRGAVRGDALHELEGPVREPVDDAEADGSVQVMRVGVLALLAGSYGEHAGGVEPLGQRGRLTRLRYEQDLVVSALLAHLFQSVRDVLGHDLGLILKLHELVAAVAGDVQEHVAPRVGE